MAQSSLEKYVEHADRQGLSKDLIRSDALDAGWTEQQIDDALAQFHFVEGRPAVPRAMMRASLRDLAAVGAQFILLGTAFIYLWMLVFNLIEYQFGDVDLWALRQLRGAIAGVLVSVPLLLLLMAYVQKRRRNSPALDLSGVRQAFGYTTLVIGGVIALFILISVLTSTLGGQLTTKALAQFGSVLVATAVVMIFLIKDTPPKFQAEGRQANRREAAS